MIMQLDFKIYMIFIVYLPDGQCWAAEKSAYAS